MTETNPEMRDLPRRRLLLVDDDGAVSKALTLILTRGGYEVVSATGAREAEAALELRFDALVVDLRMPEMRGDAFYYLACAKQPWLTKQSLFMTGDITDQAESLINATGCPSLLKPFRADMLLQLLHELLPPLPNEIERAG